MIFVTVGTQTPFERLIRAVDEWALLRKRSDVFAQIGSSDFRAKKIETAHYISPEDFRRRVEAATVIVSHAGMGSIITALEFAKPIIVMPRRADLKETRNDHQFATAKHFDNHSRITVALDEIALIDKLDEFKAPSDILPAIEPHASLQLISALRGFIESDPDCPPQAKRSAKLSFP